MIVFNSAGETELLTANASAGAAAYVLTRTPPAMCRFPRWAPDNSWIAYYRWTSVNDIGIWLVRPDGSDDHLEIPGGRWSSWSPDSRKLVYEYVDLKTMRVDLWVHTLGTAASEPLFHGEP
jgi:Tol biopolymer transport system component